VGILTAILNTLIVVICLFLICLILIQRGKGGGLAGAFGGMGGSSAFGTKAGDVFTRVTMVVAGVWIVLSMFLVILYNRGGQSAWGTDSAATATKEVAPRSNRDAGKAPASGSSTPSSPASTPSPSLPAAPVSAPAIPDSPSSQ
jgi:preprotein translocase subunit SecG